MQNILSDNTKKDLIDVLYSIRLELCTQKISGPTIKRSKLKEIIASAKNDYKDQIISKEIDKLFEEYFKDKKEDNLISNLTNHIDDNMPNFPDDTKTQEHDFMNKTKATTLVKRSSYFKQNNSNVDNNEY